MYENLWLGQKCFQRYGAMCGLAPGIRKGKENGRLGSRQGRLLREMVNPWLIIVSLHQCACPEICHPSSMIWAVNPIFGYICTVAMWHNSRHCVAQQQALLSMFCNLGFVDFQNHSMNNKHRAYHKLRGETKVIINKFSICYASVMLFASDIHYRIYR